MRDKLNNILIYFVMFLLLFIKSFLFIYLFTPEYGSVQNTIIVTLINVFTISYIYIYIAFILLVTSVYFLIKNKGRAWFLFGVNLIVSILMFVDLVFFQGFNSFVSMHHLKELTAMGEATSGIGSLISAKYFLVFADIIVLIPLILLTTKTNTTIKRSPIIFVLILLIFINCFMNENRKNQFEGLRYEPSNTIITQSPIGYHLYDIYTYIKSKYSKVTKEETNQVSEWIEENQEDLPNNEYFGMFEGKNLIAVHFESLEQFVINEKVNGQEITPNLNKLLKNSLYFDNYHEVVNEGTSSDAEYTTNTSLYPIRRGAVAYVYPKLSYNTLPVILNKNGYQTTLFHSDNKIYWNWGEMNKSIGYKRLYSEEDFDCNEYTDVGMSDGCFLSKLPNLIKQQKQPFYASVVTMTSHMPFKLPESYNELKLDDSLEGTVLGDYFQAIHYTDKQIGLLLDELEKEGVMDNTVVAVYGDHMGVHKYYADVVKNMKNIKEEWKENYYKIPLIIYQKENQKAETIHTVGNQTDFLPTVSYLLGIDGKYYKNYAMGKVLVNTNKNYTLLNNGDILSTENLTEEEKSHLLESFTVSDLINRINNPHK